ncbi:PREDICTED: ankyrin repeat family A protein 2-like isoform X2 [Branchiostoma belcheri]|uniref:Ankyrin repeat family A protein 2-like isoform X2 n=1 Tax=Branchiostoma belcheri TaxID=7741 RepID=A0A6P4XFH7_BRABE|nr:PREDICTED: ankyrin repeat family A protein 2-like isoform X2 [Branchiostoma belcheri]
MMTNRPRGNVKSTTPSIENMTIHQLAAQGEVALLSIRHDEGYDMNEVDENGLTSLMWASSHGQVGVTVFLLENGGSVHGATREGETALSFACCKGHVEIVQALLKAGANVNAFDWNGGTPLLYAIHANHPKCVQLLLCKLTSVYYKSSYVCLVIYNQFYLSQIRHCLKLTELLT